MIFLKILLFTGILFGKSDRISVDEIISRIDKNLNSTDVESCFIAVSSICFPLLKYIIYILVN